MLADANKEGLSGSVGVTGSEVAVTRDAFRVDIVVAARAVQAIHQY